MICEGSHTAANLGPRNGLCQSQGHQIKRPSLPVIGLAWSTPSRAGQNHPVPWNNWAEYPRMAAWVELRINLNYSVARQTQGGRPWMGKMNTWLLRPGLGLTRGSSPVTTPWQASSVTSVSVSMPTIHYLDTVTIKAPQKAPPLDIVPCAQHSAG